MRCVIKGLALYKVFLSLNIDLILANNTDSDEIPYSAMHFIWEFTVYQITCREPSGSVVECLTRD